MAGVTVSDPVTFNMSSVTTTLATVENNCNSEVAVLLKPFLCNTFAYIGPC